MQKQKEFEPNEIVVVKKLKVIISGGGSGGHVFPAIAIANEFKKQCPDAEILFVGAKGKIEMEKVPKAGFPIKGLWISGFHRKLALRNLMFPFKLVSSLFKAFGIIQSFKPDVVIGVGGYASGPTLQVATMKGIPTLIQEQNSFPGITNRLLAKKVNRICVAYEGMNKFFPEEKIRLTGNPVRQDIVELTDKKEEGLKHFGLVQNKRTILLFGGSLGARTLNDSMAANKDLLEKNQNVQVLWQAGKLYIEEFNQSATAQLDNVKILPFIDRMDLAYAMADVVICRAGALTISELCLVGKPAILIPSPNVAEDHQTMNAKALSTKDAGILVEDKNAKKMLEQALHILDNEQVMNDLKKNIRKLAKANAATNIVSEILQIIK
ncbi:MAG: UDP-N-acetylglucosamine--N-acetylmuramyl-(pentapeptide) pyrophosphoryl-undecaprenol N-acetylglucosamine transferase [Granulosicoccus sp.]